MFDHSAPPLEVVVDVLGILWGSLFTTEVDNILSNVLPGFALIPKADDLPLIGEVRRLRVHHLLLQHRHKRDGEGRARHRDNQGDARGQGGT